MQCENSRRGDASTDGRPPDSREGDEGGPLDRVARLVAGAGDPDAADNDSADVRLDGRRAGEGSENQGDDCDPDAVHVERLPNDRGPAIRRPPVFSLPCWLP